MVPATLVRALLRDRRVVRSDILWPVGGAGETVVGMQMKVPSEKTSFIRFNISPRAARAAATSVPLICRARP